jgi:hypothetical protein
MKILGPSRAANPPDDDADSPRLAVFVRGLTIGALVGAAIAGSAIWERTRRRAEQGPNASLPTPEAASTAEPGEMRPL